MTKKFEVNNIASLISKSHKPNVVWDMSSFYDHCVLNNYSKSKRTFEREILELGFFPALIFNKNNPSLKKIVFNSWSDVCSSKRYLSLKSSISSFNKNLFIFYEDSRGKKYWHGLSDGSEKSMMGSLTNLIGHVNKNCLIWPSPDLVASYSSIVKNLGTESIKVNEVNKVILPVSSFQKLLTNDDLIQVNNFKPSKKNRRNLSLTHLEKIEAEAIHIIRETVAEAENPVMLYSVGKDSAVMLHLAKKAFFPAAPSFPLMHVDTGWKFNEMYQFRDLMAKKAGMKLIVHRNQEGVDKKINPFDHGSEIHTDIMKTQALKQALDIHKFDFAFGGARRDEEKSRAKERILSFRSETHAWDPKNQRPELWDIYNFNKKKAESARVFPISNWTELDIWQYIYKESIPIVPLYYAAERPFVERDKALIMVDDDRFKMLDGEKIKFIKARFRTLGCYPLTGAVESNACSMSDVLLELIQATTTERDGRLIDSDSQSSMEKKKKEGYF
ncbi:sulfate adenylyltransferase subunit CysD [Gammaproteobacteria bacterium]|nr:sulfate adenylyltransferase subunit CysD [Gammaproteobacteria bacterium]